MKEDLFKSFTSRIKPSKESAATPALVVDHTPDRLPYEAFGAKDKIKTLDIRCNNGLGHVMAYTYLVNVTYDLDNYSTIFLTISGLTVTIKGRALRPIVQALQLHTCDFIQAFDRAKFNEPSDPTAPYVQSIEVEVIRRAVPVKDDVQERA